jgi:amino acid adenylation domain-containing protein/non-ribosomal peptide synthase protein (TIGR01720 family)/FkbM family methyltransferase
MVEGYRLSPQQKRVWLSQQADPDFPYASQCAIMIAGDLRPAVLNAAITKLVQRHEILRTTFQCLPGMTIPLQVITAGAVAWAPDRDLSDLKDSAQDARIAELFGELVPQPFDLTHGPLLHAALVRLAADKSLLLLRLPALCADAVTLANLLRELERGYRAELAGAEPTDEPLQYADIAEWQQQILGAEAAEAGRHYWRRQNLAAGLALRLPFEQPPKSASFAPRWVSRQLDPALAGGVAALAERLATAPATVLLACWQILCWRLTGQAEPLIATAFDGRAYEGLAEALGVLTKYLPIGCRLTAGASFDAVVAQLHAALQEAGQWQEYFSWEDWPALAGAARPSFLPLSFDFIEQSPACTGAETTFSLDQQYSCIERFDVKLACVRRADALHVEMHYDAGVYSAEAISRLTQHYLTLLASAIADPATMIAQLALLDADERAQVLVGFNDSQVDFPDDICIHQLFEAQAARAPDQIALIYEDQHLSYAALNMRANQLARHLRALGVGPDRLAALYVERSAEAFVGLLGILKAGAAYVPLDPALPAERLAFMLDDSQAAVLITDSIADLRLTIDDLEASQTPIVNRKPKIVNLLAIDDLCVSPTAIVNRQSEIVNPHNLAYVIYTSGSTGRPKGVAIEHRQLRNYICAILARLELPGSASFATVSTIAADLGNTAIFPALCGGGCLHVVAQGRAANADALAGYMRRWLIDCLKIVPSHLAALLSASQPATLLPRRRLVLGGEAASWELIQKLQALAPDCAILNHYGPTEATVGALTYAVPSADAEQRAAMLPLGRPLANVQIYLLDARGQPVPLGVPGEVYIGGAGVARGYLDRPDLTAERFVPNPFATTDDERRTTNDETMARPGVRRPASGVRLYRTGDLARFRPDGTVEFLGRADDQVKIRGFRVELGEIAAVLARHPAVQDATVVAQEHATSADAAPDKRLVAYIVPDQQSAYPVRQVLRLEQANQLDAQRRYALPNDMVIAQLNKNETDLLYHEIFEEQIYLQHGITLAEGDCIFDVGANIGMFALFAGQLCKNATIYAFEPLPPIFEVLRINTALYGLNVKLFNCGLSSANGRASFAYYPHASVMSGRYVDVREERAVIKSFVLNQQDQEGAEALGAELLDELIAERLTSERFTCQLRTLSDVIHEHGIERIDLLKLDVQKSEMDVLAGIRAEDWPRIRQIVMEVHDIDGRLEQITALLGQHGYDLVVEQEALLADTVMYDIYALRPGMMRANVPDRRADALPAVWSDPGALIDDVRRFAAAQLPDYMLPAAFVLLEALPLTPNGKLDRAALPQAQPGQPEQGRDFVAPRGAIEQVLAEIWRRLLGVERVGIDDNFFALGGHSLLATRLIARIRSTFQVDLPLSAIFETPLLADLAKQIEATVKAAQGLQFPPIQPVEHVGDLPLSLAQQGMWFLDQLDPGNPSYTIPLAVRLDGALKLDALQRGLSLIVQRHESLRTSFPAVDGRAIQVIAPARAVPLPLLDLRALPAAARAVALSDLAAVAARRPFDLARGPLFRVNVVRAADDQHLLLLHMHHIVSDGWSLRVLLRELVALYCATDERPAELPELPIRYADFAIWQRQWLQGDVLERLLDYWRGALADAPLVLELPTDRPRPAVVSYRGATMTIQLSAPLSAGLRGLVRQEGATMYMTLLAAFKILLARYTGQRDIVIGSSTANRTRGETEELIGLFLNILLVRTDLSSITHFRELVRRVRAVTLAAYAHQDLPFDQLVGELQPERDLSRNPLFQVSFVFLNLPPPTEGPPGLSLSLLEVDSGASQVDLTLTMMDTEQELRGWLEYSTDLFDQATMVRLLSHFQTLLEGIVAAPDRSIWLLPLLPEVERSQLLVEWNATATAYPHDQCAPRLFESQVERTPDAVAAVYADSQLTYRELNARANQLARHLRALGVGPDVLIALCVEPSPELLIGMLGILKAGGAYVPLDRSYPAARLAFMLEDSAAPLILTQSQLADTLPASWAYVLQLDADWPAISAESSANLTSAPDTQQLAYVIYTSGSTGTPKGVLVTHTNLAHATQARFAYYDEPITRFLLIASVAFDSSVAGLFWTLCQGGTLVIPAEQARADRDALIRTIHQHKISHMTWLPSLYALVLDAALPTELCSLRTLIVAGEACPPTLVARHRQLLPQTGLFNEYGPTEGTVWSSVYACAAPEDRPILIGRPIPNVQIYLLDAELQPVPIGVPGEVYIGGAGIARGYLNRPDVTAERFVPNPFATTNDATHARPVVHRPASCVRLYKTGDLARYRPDGNLEFLGRIDDQVKLRGFRIELGEIETALAQHPAVQEVAALVREDGGTQRLVAYVVPAADERRTTNDESASSSSVLRPSSFAQELRAFLHERLPEYMLPAAFVLLDALPLTPNGKIDRRALPAPDSQRSANADSFAAPRTPVEAALAVIWGEILQLDQVGIHDDFFNLGGDSILSIQIIAKAQQVGLYFTPKQLFQHQTIAALAAVAGVVPIVVAEQGLIEGAVPLTPIQRWLFEQNRPEPHYYNQPLLLETRQPLDLALLEQALQHLRTHHDALRMRFVQGAVGWRAINDATVPPLVVDRLDYSALSPAEQTAAITAEGSRLQASLDLATGQLMRAAIFDLGAGQPARLLLLIHHLVVDGVSWRILLEDLHTVYAQLKQGQPVALPPKTTAFQQWAERLVEHAHSDELRQELDYWLAEPRRQRPPMPIDQPGGDNTIASTRTISLLLSAEETDALLHRVPQAYRSQINDVLLTALVQAWQQWTGAPVLLLDLEGHGREDLFADVDLSRTVGWFTSLFPVRLDLGQTSGPVAALQSIKEQLRQLPNRGVGYGLLRYLSDDETRAQLRALPQTEINFNYLGQADQSLPESGLFNVATESIGPIEAPSSRRAHLLEISGIVVAGRLRLDLAYSEQLHQRATIMRLADEFLAALRALIAQSGAALSSGYTPFDFPLAQLDQPTLERVIGANWQVEDIYPLVPLQQGMLFHTLYAPESGAYFKQIIFTLRGDLDIPAFQRAWQHLADRHASLRTAFVWEGLATPVQVVHRHMLLPWELQDWRGLAPGEQAERLAQYLAADRRRGFVLSQAPLIHLTLLQTAADTYQFIWSQHHLLMDGWSVPLVLNEAMQCYVAFTRGQTPQLAPPLLYRDYIAWLQRQDQTQAETFWRRELRGFRAATQLRVERAAGTAPGQADDYAEQSLTLAPDATSALQVLARRHGLTLNTLVQGAWLLLLHHYSGSDDLVFGATVAGRPPELAGSASMVGLFINTLPVRVRYTPHAPLLPWLRALQDQQLDLRQHAYSPLVQIQGWSSVPRGQPLFESIVVFENYPIDRTDRALAEHPDLTIQNVRSGERMGFPLTLLALPGPTLALWISYACQRFADATVQRMLAHLQTLLRGIVAQPARRLADVPILTTAEQQLLIDWNDTGSEPRSQGAGFRSETSGARCLQELFEEQARRVPDAIALVGEAVQLSYDELNRRANQLAHHLRARGVVPEVAVGLSIERSPAMVVGLLGVLKAGGVYVPLDPLFPQERLSFMLADARAPVLLVATKDGGRRTEDGGRVQPVIVHRSSFVGQVVDLDGDWPTIAQECDANPVSATRPANGLYIIYTSGSTGRPKGVLIEQRQVLNYVHALIERLGCPPDMRFAMVQPLTVDSSVTVIYPALCGGGSLHVIDAERVADPDAFGDYMRRYAVDCLKIAPSHLAALQGGPHPEHVLPRHRLVIGGEASAAGWAAQLLPLMPHGAIFNHYGPTETTVGVLTYRLAPAQLADLAGTLPIGRPLANVQAYVLDGDQRPTPLGVPGELYIGGAQVARGYLGRPDLTAERFVPNPFATTNDERRTTNNEPDARPVVLRPSSCVRLYKTGDLARYRPDGAIEFLGRIDDQVKIRGFRVELGEIEALLRRHPAVSDAIVVAATGDSGDVRLVAYLVPTKEEGRTANDAEGDASRVLRPSSFVSDLRDFLHTYLPGYMLPRAYIVLEAFPRTPHGKVDRRALPAPDAAQAARDETAVAPRTPTEEILAQIWSEVLGLERVGVHDNFFELGGHSLLATRMIFRLREAFQVELPLRSLFDAPTVADLAALLARRMGTPTAADERYVALPTLVPDPAQRHEPFPLTDIQEAYWVGRSDAFELGNVATHSYMEIETVGLDIERFGHACQRLIDRHDMLRAIILPDGRQQVLAQLPAYQITILDLREQPPELVESALADVREQLSHQVLPTDQWPLFELQISRIDDQHARLHISTDALIFDGWSRGMLIREFNWFYLHPDAELPPLELSFRDYVLGDLALRESELYQRSLRYWRARLATLPPAPELPLAQSPSDLVQPQFVRRNTHLEPERWLRLKQRAAHAGLTSSGLVLAAFAEVLATWSKSPRFTINLTLFNRLPLHPQVNDIVGDFTSLTLLAVDNRAPEAFEARARRVQAQLWEDLDHRYVSGVQVLRELARSQGGVPGATMPIVLTSTLTLRQAGGDVASLDQFREIAYSISQTPQVWLDHQVSERPQGLLLNWDAVEDLFPEGLLDDMFAAYCGFLRQLADDESSWHAPRRLVPLAQIEQRAARNASIGPIPAGPAGLLHRLFAAQLPSQAQQLAVVAGMRSLTYAEVERHATTIAAWLHERAARPNSLVAVVMEKGWEQIVAVLGVLQSGAAYLPIDPALPPDRLRYLLEHSNVTLALTQSWIEPILGWPAGVTRLCVDTVDARASAPTQAGASWPPAQDVTDLAYVIYTSGSTGQPKGVMIDHRAAVNTLLDINRRFAVGPRDRVLALSALSFDLSVYDIFGVLAAGGAIIVPPETARRDPAQWVDLLVEQQITIWNSVPALMQMLVDYIAGRGGRLPSALRLVLLSGDWVPVGLPDQIRALGDDIQVISLGGATEAAIWSILYPITDVDPDWTSIPYGSPMMNQQFHVLNAALEPCPVWVPGQLYIGGIGLAQGYWRDPVKTAERFVPNPFPDCRLQIADCSIPQSAREGRWPLADGSIPQSAREGRWPMADGSVPQSAICNLHSAIGERLYKTGDLGRYLPDGTIEFLGREDFQVKVQGHRIELGEIEAALAEHALVRSVVVTALGDPRGSRRLVAYVVPDQAQLAARQPARTPPPTDAVRAQGAAALPLSRDALSADADDAALLGPLARLEFKLRQAGVRREPERAMVPLVKPTLDDALRELYTRRRSYRTWQPAPIAFDQFSSFLSCLMQLQLDDAPLPKYRYPSAGSLYPVQIYLHIKPERVEGLDGGTYYYHPGEHGLVLLTAAAPIDRSVHSPINRSLFDESAFTLFLVGHMPAIAPLYEAMARDFCLLEAGYASQLLMTAAPAQQIGLCPLGTVEFDRIRDFFALDESDILLHSMLGGSIAPVLAANGGAPGVAAPALRVTNGPRDKAVADELRQFLLTKLPEYMLPTSFVLLDALPLTPNGKVDRRALPVPAEARPAPSSQPGMPLTDVQQTITAVWQAVLRVEQVGLEDNFFELGGSSIHLVRMHSQLRDALQREIPLVDLFKYPTISALADYLSQQHDTHASFQDIHERMQKQKAALARQKPRKSRS